MHGGSMHVPSIIIFTFDPSITNCRGRWCEEYKLRGFGLSERSLLLSYYLATSSLFEPEHSNLRFAWAKTAALIETIRSYFGRHENSISQRKAFVHEFTINSKNVDYINFQRWLVLKKDCTNKSYSFKTYVFVFYNFK